MDDGPLTPPVADTPDPVPVSLVESPTNPLDGTPTVDARLNDLSTRVAALEALVASHLPAPSEDVTVIVEPVKTRVDRLFAHIFGE